MLGTQRYAQSENWWVRHSLSIILILLLVAQMVGFHLTTLPTWVSAREVHGESTVLWPDYWLHYWSRWLHGILADTYGALLIVLLTKHFYEQGSAESKDL